MKYSSSCRHPKAHVLLSCLIHQLFQPQCASSPGTSPSILSLSASSRARVGQTSTHTGCSINVQRSHLRANFLSGQGKITAKGHSMRHVQQAMQRSSRTTTMPLFVSRTKAPLGQAFKQGASTHCRHWSGSGISLLPSTLTRGCGRGDS